MSELEYLTVDHLSTKEIKRIFSNITIDPITGCWNWQGYRNPDGYGRVRFRNRLESVHRLLYAWLVAPLPRGRKHDVLHLDHEVCNNRACANPSHITLKSQRENILRGSAPTAINARKTHCIHGHPLPEEKNNRNARRRCKICYRLCDAKRNQTEERKAYRREQSRLRMRTVITTDEYRAYRRAYLARKRTERKS